MFWACPRLSEFWSAIFKFLSDAFEVEIQPTMETAIFGVLGSCVSVNSTQRDAFAFATLLARRRILLNWKSAYPPKVSHWLRDLLLFLELEKIKYSLRGSTKNFYTTWKPVLSHFEKLQSLALD